MHACMHAYIPTYLHTYLHTYQHRKAAGLNNKFVGRREEEAGGGADEHLSFRASVHPSERALRRHVR